MIKANGWLSDMELDEIHKKSKKRKNTEGTKIVNFKTHMRKVPMKKLMLN